MVFSLWLNLKLIKLGVTSMLLKLGLPEPKIVPEFEGLSVNNGFYSSKHFLPLVSKASKPGIL